MDVASEMGEVGKASIGLGLLLVILGAAILLAGRMGLPLGRLPGDVTYRGKGFSVYFPLASCVVLSVIVSLVLYLLSRLHK